MNKRDEEIQNEIIKRFVGPINNKDLLEIEKIIR